jgi:hypothetical protein
LLISDRERPLRDWRTSSLLTELRSQLIAPASNGDQPLENVVAEISQRGINVEQLFRDRFVIDWAFGVYLRTTLRHGDDLVAAPDWKAVIDEFDDNHIEPDGPMAALSDDLLVAGEGDSLLPDVRVLLALISWAMSQDMARVLWGGAPEPGALRTISLTRTQTHTDSVWLIDRFTETYLSDWRHKSLIQEWLYSHSRRRGCCPAPIMRERAIDAAELNLEIAHRVSQDEAEPVETELLHVSSFTPLALKLLYDGNTSDAASIYRAVVELRPDNYEALNNLGFCLIPTSPLEAITALDRCAKLRGSETTNAHAAQPHCRVVLGW